MLPVAQALGIQLNREHRSARLSGTQPLHLFVVPQWITIGFVVLIAVAGWASGEWRQRVIAFALLAEFLIGYCGAGRCAWPSHEVWDVKSRALFDDTLILATCIWCLIEARRYWIVWACAFALLGVITDATSFGPRVSTWAGPSASLIWSYALGWTVIWSSGAAIRERGRRVQAGRTPSP